MDADAGGRREDEAAKLIADWVYEWVELPGRNCRWEQLGEQGREDYRILAQRVAVLAPAPAPEARGPDVERTMAKIKQAEALISDLNHGRREWLMSIPAQREYDPDLVIGDALHWAAQLLARTTGGRDEPSDSLYIELRKAVMESGYVVQRINGKLIVFPEASPPPHGGEAGGARDEGALRVALDKHVDSMIAASRVNGAAVVDWAAYDTKLDALLAARDGGAPRGERASGEVSRIMANFDLMDVVPAQTTVPTLDLIHLRDEIRRLRYSSSAICPDCRGLRGFSGRVDASGGVHDATECGRCDGTGQIPAAGTADDGAREADACTFALKPARKWCLMCREEGAPHRDDKGRWFHPEPGQPIDSAPREVCECEDYYRIAYDVLARATGGREVAAPTKPWFVSGMLHQGAQYQVVGLFDTHEEAAGAAQRLNAPPPPAGEARGEGARDMTAEERAAYVEFRRSRYAVAPAGEARGEEAAKILEQAHEAYVNMTHEQKVARWPEYVVHCWRRLTPWEYEYMAAALLAARPAAAGGEDTARLDWLYRNCCSFTVRDGEGNELTHEIDHPTERPIRDVVDELRAPPAAR